MNRAVITIGMPIVSAKFTMAVPIIKIMISVTSSNSAISVTSVISATVVATSSAATMVTTVITTMVIHSIRREVVVIERSTIWRWSSVVVRKALCLLWRVSCTWIRLTRERWNWWAILHGGLIWWITSTHWRLRLAWPIAIKAHADGRTH